MTAPKVRRLRSGPLINDVPGQLRHMADEIEAGRFSAAAVVLVVPRTNDWPEIFGWGVHMGDLENIATMELAKLWFANNLTERSTSD